jgi:hypothetical protein
VTTGMELDIHSRQQSFTAFTADPSGAHQPHKLMTTMSGRCRPLYPTGRT